MIIDYFIKKRENVNPVYFKDIEKYYPEIISSVFVNQHTIHLEANRSMLEKGVSQGIFRDDLNLDLVSSTLKTLILNTYEDLNNIVEFEHKDFLRDVLFAYLNGLSTEKGRNIIEKEQGNILSCM
jgi:hypothetical protein